MKRTGLRLVLEESFIRGCQVKFRSSSALLFPALAITFLGSAPTLALAQIGAGSAGAKTTQIDPRQSQPVPRLANGKPDFSGVWDHPRVTDFAVNSHVCAAGSVGCESISSGPLPYTAAGLVANTQKLKFDHTALCLPWGYLRSWNGLYPNQIIQSTEAIGMLFEQNNNFKVIPTDGRPQPKDVEPTWFGHSVGHWEGDVLIIDTIGFNGETWLDTGLDIKDDPHAAPHVTTSAMHMTERMSRPDFTHLHAEITIEDPNLYTAPIKNTRTYVLMKPGSEVMEFSCEENNKEVTEHHLVEFGTKPK
jgi:hypothetical protein